jgi:2-amino-4-hydroxy-6-hydroxymethyldihydropteridine diphosphokinase
MTRIYLSLGSNVGDREANLHAALGALADKVRIDAVSSLYETDPVGITDQPPFLNLAAGGTTDLAPRELLTFVKEIEHEIGRRPTFRWGPRVVDIDILLYGDESVAEPDLTIPHVEMPNRAFVLVPLTDIAPDAVHPGLGMSVRQLLASVPGGESVRPYL